MSAILGDDTGSILGVIISLMAIGSAAYGILSWQSKKVRDATTFKERTQNDIMATKKEVDSLQGSIRELETKLDSTEEKIEVKLTKFKEEMDANLVTFQGGMDKSIQSLETKLQSMYCDNKEIIDKSNQNMLEVTSAISKLTGKIDIMQDKL